MVQEYYFLIILKFFKRIHLIQITSIFGYYLLNLSKEKNILNLIATTAATLLLMLVNAAASAAATRSYEQGKYFSSNHVVAASFQQQQQPLHSGCPDPDCQRCNVEGCIKCRNLLIQDDRTCTDVCPSGYLEQWSASPDYMGRICVSQGLSQPLLAAITGLVAGTLICFSVVLIAIFLMKRKRRRTSVKKKLINENIIDRDEFIRQIEEMRPDVEYFLAMLNDSRRQIRKLYLSGEAATANQYRPIIRDLAKILILLNRPIELIPEPPHDWNRIYNWSEQALERYKPKIGQLIDFLQSPTDETNHLVHYHLGPNVGDPRHSFHSLQHQQKFQLFGSLISLHEFDEPIPNNNFNTLNKGNLISDLNASSLWLEDEFFKLGFRPQDEITTEL